MSRPVNEGFEKAIELCGGMSALAERMGEKPSTLGTWRTNGRVAARKVLAMVRAVDGQVKPYKIDKELYPDPKWLPPDVLKKRAKRKPRKVSLQRETQGGVAPSC